VGDITTGDLDRDGDLDLVVTNYSPMSTAPGLVAVLAGNGAGSFAPPTFYEAGVQGEYTVVVADFTGDGILDVATGNQSTFRDDDLGQQLSDSMTFVRGTGDGALADPVTLRLTYENDNSGYPVDVDDRQRVPVVEPVVIGVGGHGEECQVVLEADRAVRSSEGKRRPIRRQGLAQQDRARGADQVRDTVPAEITARVTFVGRVNPWTKAGIMLRGHSGPQSPHASLFVTPSTVKGIAFQRRRTDGGVSVHSSGPAITAPIWLKLVVDGPMVRAYYRTDLGSWTLVGEDTIQNPSSRLGMAGLAVSSHVDGRLAEARFDHVSVRSLGTFAEQDIGAVGLAGSGTISDLRVTMEGAGADIWGTADAFRFRSTFTNTMDVRLAARIVSVEATHEWAKAGVMFRERRDATSRHVTLIVSPGRGVAMQYRATSGGATGNVAVVPGAAPNGYGRGARARCSLARCRTTGRRGPKSVESRWPSRIPCSRGLR
jgi:hypothetical protein